MKKQIIEKNKNELKNTIESEKEDNKEKRKLLRKINSVRYDKKNRTSKILRVIFLILIVATCMTIFMFSNQNGQVSKGISGRVLESIIDFLPNTKNLPKEEKRELIRNSQTLIRKSAHFAIYTLLGMALMGFMTLFKMARKNKIIIAFSIGVLYAISDEVHQMFSAGRTAKVTDVLIDSCGLLFGILIILLIVKIVKRRGDKFLVKE